MTHIRFAEILKDYLDDRNISNKEFAARIGITPKHLIDILSGELELTTAVIQAISIVTNIPVDYIINIEQNYRIEENIKIFLNEKNITLTQYLNKFSYKELIKNKWINFTYVDDKMHVMMDILKYLRVSNPSNLYKIDKNILYKSKNDKTEMLMIWLEKCYKIASKQIVSGYTKKNIQHLVEFILDCAQKGKFEEDELINEFNTYGIKLVIQDDLPGSKIRGAFKVNKNIPSIYLTRKYKRIADIYYALLHELAHCKSDFNKAKSTNLVSYDNEKCEDRADAQALNWMVNNEYYESIVLKKINNYDAKMEYPMCFILYRLALDKYIDYSDAQYQKYNFIIKSLQK
ncbi:MAG: helix-turn-helix transcriptional regulator [Firmicutes bacterium]|nr:helix-turn-helix transcriptional regulator [Bacillota bacterium]